MSPARDGRAPTRGAADQVERVDALEGDRRLPAAARAVSTRDRSADSRIPVSGSERDDGSAHRGGWCSDTEAVRVTRPPIRSALTTGAPSISSGRDTYSGVSARGVRASRSVTGVRVRAGTRSGTRNVSAVRSGHATPAHATSRSSWPARPRSRSRQRSDRKRPRRRRSSRFRPRRARSRPARRRRRRFVGELHRFDTGVSGARPLVEPTGVGRGVGAVVGVGERDRRRFPDAGIETLRA